MNCLMKRLNVWIEKFGVDKLLHFFVAAWLVALCLLFGFVDGIVGAFIVVFLSCVKETVLDESADIRDVFWTFGGSLSSLIVGALYYFVCKI